MTIPEGYIEVACIQVAIDSLQQVLDRREAESKQAEEKVSVL